MEDIKFDTEGCTHWVIFFEMEAEKAELHIHHLVGYGDVPTVEEINENIEELKTEVYPNVSDAVDYWTHTVLTTEEMKNVLPEMFE